MTEQVTTQRLTIPSDQERDLEADVRVTDTHIQAAVEIVTHRHPELQRIEMWLDVSTDGGTTWHNLCSQVRDRGKLNDDGTAETIEWFELQTEVPPAMTGVGGRCRVRCLVQRGALANTGLRLITNDGRILHDGSPRVT